MAGENLRASVDENELKNLQRFADEWWNPEGPAKLLHQMIPAIRIPMMIDGLTKCGLIKSENRDKSNIFEGIKVLDVGSGVGLMSEALAHLGAEVVGVDPSDKHINVANDHLKNQENLKVTYICDTAESYCLSNANKYDAVTFFDVAEHVADVRSVLAASVKCLKPGGRIFITTWNQTWIGWFYDIIILEYLTGIVPRGAHSWKLFVKPEKIEEILKDCGCKDVELRGTWYSLWTRDWSFTDDYPDCFYAMQAVKEK